jgi:rubrerythrin
VVLMAVKTDKTFEKKLKENIVEEAHATKMYRRMAEKAPTKTDKKTLRGIARQEDLHRKKQTKILKHIKK